MATSEKVTYDDFDNFDSDQGGVMASIRHSISMNKKILTFIVVLLVGIIILLGKIYFYQRHENKALRIKMLSMGANKKNPKSWATLVTKPSARIQDSAVTTNSATSTQAPAVNKTDETAANAEVNEDTYELASKLDAQMREVKNANVEDIDKNIALAQEIISREPDSYGAYKAKLISLLVKEGKFNQEVDETEIESLLESMAQFNIGSDKLARREAALISNTNSGLQQVELQLENLARTRENIETQLANLDPNSREGMDLNSQLEQIEANEAQLALNMDNLEESLANNTDQMINEDIVEIPFMRMLAKNDYDGVIANAESFIEQFPNSPSGYFYLIKAYEQQGLKEEANDVIKNAKLPESMQQVLLHRLDSQNTDNPTDYWKNLNF